jgi:16S rRNA G966 N2-methylase RsmD
MDGTAIAVLRNSRASHLKEGIFIDASTRVVEILNLRIKSLPISGINAYARQGDYSDASNLCNIVAKLSKRSLNLVFIDPTECDVPFSTIKHLVTELQNADLPINVALGTDVNRNIVSAIRAPTHVRARQKYEEFLGEESFCSRSDVVAWPTAEITNH